MTPEIPPLSIAVLLGSVRHERMGIRAARLVVDALEGECPIPRISTALDEDGHPQNEHVPLTLNRFLDEFEWYARALRRQRQEGTPY